MNQWSNEIMKHLCLIQFWFPRSFWRPKLSSSCASLLHSNARFLTLRYKISYTETRCSHLRVKSFRYKMNCSQILTSSPSSLRFAACRKTFITLKVHCSEINSYSDKDTRFISLMFKVHYIQVRSSSRYDTKTLSQIQSSLDLGARFVTLRYTL